MVWPVEKANLLPSRFDYLLEIGNVLQGRHAAEEAIKPMQGELYGPEQARLSVREEYGFVYLPDLIAGSERLQVVELIARQHRFFHWELEFADVFAERGEFDLILGNPPWIRVEWDEGGVMGDVQPLLAIRDFSAPQLSAMRAQAFEERPKLRAAYLKEDVEFEGTQAFLNTQQNFPLLVGSPRIPSSVLLRSPGRLRKASRDLSILKAYTMILTEVPFGGAYIHGCDTIFSSRTN